MQIIWGIGPSTKMLGGLEPLGPQKVGAYDPQQVTHEQPISVRRSVKCI